MSRAGCMRALLLSTVMVAGTLSPARAADEGGVVTSAARTAATVLWIIGGVVTGIGVADMAMAGVTTAGAVALGTAQGDKIGFIVADKTVTGIPGMLLAGSAPIGVMGGVGLVTSLVGIGLIAGGVVLRLLF